MKKKSVARSTRKGAAKQASQLSDAQQSNRREPAATRPEEPSLSLEVDKSTGRTNTTSSSGESGDAHVTPVTSPTGTASNEAAESVKSLQAALDGEAANSTASSAESTPKTPPPIIQIASIGDVGADWAFISSLPSEPDSDGAYEPWKKLSATHLYAFPGGAWFTGHMVQAALEGPRFSRTYQATISTPQQEGDKGARPTDVEIAGTVKNRTGGGWIITPSKNARLEITSASQVNREPFRTTPYPLNTEAVILTESEDHDVKVSVRPVEATLRFDAEHTLDPGRIEPDQIHRVFHAYSVSLYPKATMEPHNVSDDQDAAPNNSTVNLTVWSLTVKGRALRVDGSTTVEDHTSVSVRCIQDSPSHIEERVFYISAVDGNEYPVDEPPLHFKKADITVLYGDLNVHIDMRDQGKLYSPLEFDPKIEHSKLAYRQRLLVQLKDRSIPHRHLLATETANPDNRLWYYANPGKELAMQDSTHIVHTLNELARRQISKASNHEQKVYRRIREHGVEGPQGHSPTILDYYEPSPKFANPADPEHAALQARARSWNSSLQSAYRLLIVDDDGLGFAFRPDTWAPFLPKPMNELQREFDEIIGEYDTSGQEIVHYQDKILQLAEALQIPNESLRAILSNSDCGQRWPSIADVRRREVQEQFANTFIIVKASRYLDPQKSTLLRTLYDYGIQDRCIIVITGETLRDGLFIDMNKSGVKLARRVSWEQTIDDFMKAVGTGQLNQLMPVCRHLFVLLPIDGAIHVDNVTLKPGTVRLPTPDKFAEKLAAEASIKLFFDYERIEGEYANTEMLGEVPGITTVFVAALTRSIYRCWCQQYQSDAINVDNNQPAGEPNAIMDEALESGVKYALQACRRYYDLGYGPSPTTVRRFENLHFPLVQVFGDAPVVGCTNDGRHEFEVFSVGNSVQHEGRVSEHAGKATTWSIIGRRLAEGRGAGESNPSFARLTPAQKAVVKRALSALELAKRIVMNGIKNVQRDFSSRKFPIGRFDKLVSVDRQEIEGLRSIKNILGEYCNSTARDRPISLAVFGPPGSGKSYGVKQIAREVAGDIAIQDFTFNLAQFVSFSEVTKQLLTVRDAALENKLPLVFFDEFDSEMGKQQPLGWLKYFLSPMQDGRFQHDQAMLGIGRAIFVFAGGLASTHAEFNNHDDFWRKAYPSSGNTDIFKTAKGPDFHGRLRGYLNIMGPNPVLGEFNPVTSNKPDKARDELVALERTRYDGQDFIYVVRRAILIRQTIEEFHGAASGKALLDADGRARIDDDVMNALLLNEGYHHGVRSLQAILEMSSLFNQGRISKTTLPPWEQCAMHVHESFRDILIHDLKSVNTVIRDVLVSQSDRVE